MAYSVEWTARARDDVENALSYIERVLKSPAAAAKHLEAFIDAANQLAETPAMCVVSTQPSLARRQLRARFVKRYVMLYSFDGERVCIYRVFHTLQDYARLVR